MKYTYLYLLALCVLIIPACTKTELPPEEDQVEIDEGETDPDPVNCDAMNVSLESTHVIIEQTGTWCPTCGGEKDEIQAGIDYHPRVHHMAVHGGSDPFANDRTDEFRSMIIRSPYFPTLMGTIDPSFMDFILAETPKTQVKLDVTKDGDVLKITVKLEILGDYVYARENGCAVFVDGEQVNVFDYKSLNIGLYLLEDGLEYPQAGYGALTHNDVMRDYISGRVQGDMVTDFGEAVSMGDSFCMTYEYNLGANTFHEDIENCKIMALVVEGNKCETTETEWYLNFKGSDVFELAGL